MCCCVGTPPCRTLCCASVRRELLDTAERHQLGESERVASLQASLEASLASLRHQVRRVQCFSPHCLPAKPLLTPEDRAPCPLDALSQLSEKEAAVATLQSDTQHLQTDLERVAQEKQQVRFSTEWRRCCG